MIALGMAHTENAWCHVFLETLSSTGSITEAAKAAGVSRTLAYTRREEDDDFGAAWDVALERSNDSLEDEAVNRGRVGIYRPIFYKGVQIAEVREPSDSLLMFMLKGRRPERFREAAAQVSVNTTINQLEVRERFEGKLFAAEARHLTLENK